MSTKKQPISYTIQDCTINMKPSKKSEIQYEVACALRALAESLKYEDKSYGVYIAPGTAPEVNIE